MYFKIQIIQFVKTLTFDNFHSVVIRAPIFIIFKIIFCMRDVVVKSFDIQEKRHKHIIRNAEKYPIEIRHVTLLIGGSWVVLNL